jgi:hypothetical protein
VVSVLQALHHRFTLVKEECDPLQRIVCYKAEKNSLLINTTGTWGMDHK